MKKVEVSELQGPLGEFYQQIGGANGRERFEEFKLWLKKVTVGILPELKVWKTIKLGVHKTPQAYEEALKMRFRIGDWASEILHKITVSETVVEMDLCVKTVAELGFNGNARYEDICRRIVEIGGELCPAEVGPALRDQYEDQPYGEWNLIAMEAISDLDGDLRVFGVGHDRGDRWLSTYGGRSGSLSRPGLRVVFVIPRKLDS